MIEKEQQEMLSKGLMAFWNCPDYSRKISFLKQQQSLIEIITKTKKIIQMLYWCHYCSKITFPTPVMKCQYCSSDAIQEIQEQNNPSQYIPPSIEAPSRLQQRPIREVSQMIDENEDPFARLFSMIRPQRVTIRTYYPQPVFTLFRIIQLPEQEEHKSVDQEKIKQLQRVQKLQHECAICQQREGSGLMLACKHEFHQNCIKPWFSNSNTCPCCRAVI